MFIYQPATPSTDTPLSFNTRARATLTHTLSVHPLLLPEQWVAPLAGVSIKKHKGATGGLHGHARPIIYIDSPGAFEKCRVGHIQYPVQRFHHESLLFDFHLPIVTAVRGNQAAVSTCNNCLSLHRNITLLLHLWWCISLASYQLKMNLTIIIKKYCIVHFMFSQRADSSYGSTFKFTREQNFECFPASMTANVIILILSYFQKHTFLAISPLWCPSKHGRCSRVSAFRRAEWFNRSF